MADLLQQIVQFLNINCNIVNCVYPNPMEGIFYLVLLPTVLIILFIYFISSLVTDKLGSYAGAKLMVGIVIYIFIILQGWFTVFVSLSQVWIILVIVIGIIVFVIRHFRGGGSRKSGEWRTGKSTMARLFRIPSETAKKKLILPALSAFEEGITGEPGEKKYVESCIRQTKRAIAQWKKTPESDSENKSNMYKISTMLLEKLIMGTKDYEKEHGSRAAPYWGRVRDLEKELGIEKEASRAA